MLEVHGCFEIMREGGCSPPDSQSGVGPANIGARKSCLQGIRPKKIREVQMKERYYLRK